jgi:O-antigen/teichoic acid export membrane protein
VNSETLHRIERLNYLLGAVVVLVTTLLLPRDHSLGAAVGAALTCLNFTVLRVLVGRWMNAPRERRGRVMVLLLPKMALLMLAVFLAIRYLPISAPGLALGFSVFIPSMLIEAMRSAIFPPAGSPSTDDPKGTETK